MAKPFHLDIVTHQGIFYSKDIISLIVPSEAGYLGVLADHAPLAASLGTGKITIRDILEKTTSFNTEAGGFIEVLKNRATILVESLSEKDGNKG